MKLPTIIAAFVLLSSGCIVVPSPYSTQLKPVLERYATIRSGDARAQIEAQLGAPARVDDAGSSIWEARFDDRNYAVAKVWFDANDRAQKVEITHSHGQRSPLLDTHAVSTRAQ